MKPNAVALVGAATLKASAALMIPVLQGGMVLKLVSVWVAHWSAVALLAY